MSQTFSRTVASSEALDQIVALLERHRDAIPSVDEELARHRAMGHALEEHGRRSEQALCAWREALSQRWECEVSSQRIYLTVQRQVSEYFGSNTAYAQLVAPAHPTHAATASDLLEDMRRLAASLELLNPRPPFAGDSLAQLNVASENLARAIEWTRRCEAERRQVMIEQRMTVSLYRRAYNKTLRLLEDVLPEGDLPLTLEETSL